MEDADGVAKAIASALTSDSAMAMKAGVTSGHFGERPAAETAPGVAYVKGRFGQWLADSSGGLWCPHDPEKFAEMYWSPIAPGIMCDWCRQTWTATLTDEQNHACDVCGLEKDHDQEWWISNIMLGAWVMDSGQVMPPLVILFGICLPCGDKIRGGEITCPLPATPA